MALDTANHCYAKYGDLFVNNFNADLVYDACVNTPVVVAMLGQRSSFYRIRKNIDEKRENLGLATTYSYPSQNLCTENGRAHVHGYPVFYCSDTMKVTISEARAEEGDLLYVSEWELAGPCAASLCVIASREAIGNGTFSSIHPFIEEELDRMGGSDRLAKWTQLLGGLQDIFLHERHPYSNSAIYSYKMMYERAVEIICYPSAQWRNTFINLAIKKEFIDRNKIILKNIYKLIVTSDSKSLSTFSLLEVGTAKSKKIDWLAPTQPDQEKFFAKFMSDNGTLLVTFPQGKTLDDFKRHMPEIDRKMAGRSAARLSEDDKEKSLEFLEAGLEKSHSGNYHDAIKEFDRAIDLFSYMPSPYYERGLCNYYIGKYDDAIIDYTSAIHAAPKDVEVSTTYKSYCNRGTIYQMQKQYEKAVSDFQAAIQHKPDDCISHFNLGNCLVEMGRYSEAVESYKSALQIEPDDIEILDSMNAALNYLKEGK
ncbi:MAG: tetratricopeptide repeat protein [Nitrospirota bacterium]|nr:tetratricopeptide repeat protein [Nitrospirota bacterium]